MIQNQILHMREIGHVYCRGQSINRSIKVRIVGLVAHPRMHIRLRRPSQVIRVITEGGW